MELTQQASSYDACLICYGKRKTQILYTVPLPPPILQGRVINPLFFICVIDLNNCL
jgi:hypothetical protein